MKKIISIILIGLFSLASKADYVGNLSIKSVMTSGNGSEIAFTSMPAGTCSYYSSTVRFDSSTPAGKTLLTTLLTAHIAERKVDIWFNRTTPNKAGQDCSYQELSVLFMVRVK